jgi:DNA mismatch endonuclease (patch repair protein)
MPKTRPEFWAAKINANRMRDTRAIEALLSGGWHVLVVWECATRSFQVDDLIGIIAAWLHGTETNAELSSDGLSTDRRVRAGFLSGEQEAGR